MSTLTTILVFSLITIIVFAAFAPIVTCIVLKNFSVMMKWAYDTFSKTCTDAVTQLLKYTTLIISRVMDVIKPIITWVLGQYSILVDCILYPTNF